MLISLILYAAVVFKIIFFRKVKHSRSSLVWDVIPRKFVVENVKRTCGNNSLLRLLTEKSNMNN